MEGAGMSELHNLQHRRWALMKMIERQELSRSQISAVNISIEYIDFRIDQLQQPYLTKLNVQL